MATDETAPKQTNWLLWIGCGVLLVLLLGCGGFIAFCGGAAWLGVGEVKKQEQEIAAAPGTAITAETLSKAYKDNSITATGSYGNQVLIVTGKIVKKPSDSEIELAGTAGGDNVKCSAGLSNLTLFSSVNVGDTVEVKGRCAGDVFGSISVTSCQTITKK